MSERGLPARTVRYTDVVLKSAMHQAVQWRLLLENPATGVLRAGATDAIRKGALKDEEVLVRLDAAQEIHRREDAQGIRARGLNVNATVVPGVFTDSWAVRRRKLS